MNRNNWYATKQMRLIPNFYTHIFCHFKRRVAIPVFQAGVRGVCILNKVLLKIELHGVYATKVFKHATFVLNNTGTMHVIITIQVLIKSWSVICMHAQSMNQEKVV